MYMPDHFKIEELVPKQVHNERGFRAWELLDDRLLITLDQLRDEYGSITVNDWLWGGINEWRGLRTPKSAWYRPYSQHTFGRAADCIFNDVNVDKVRADILKYPDRFPCINSIELDTPHLHFDVRNCDRIKTYMP
jgi:hypothetical protein